MSAKAFHQKRRCIWVSMLTLSHPQQMHTPDTGGKKKQELAKEAAVHQTVSFFPNGYSKREWGHAVKLSPNSEKLKLPSPRQWVSSLTPTPDKTLQLQFPAAAMEKLRGKGMLNSSLCKHFPPWISHRVTEQCWEVSTGFQQWQRRQGCSIACTSALKYRRTTFHFCQVPQRSLDTVALQEEWTKLIRKLHLFLWGGGGNG